MGTQNRKVKCSWCWTIAPFSIICLSQGTALFAWRCPWPRPQLSVSTVTNYKQQSLPKRRIISPLPSPAKRHEMKCFHTCFHRDGINTSLIGSWRHLRACVLVVLRPRCPKEQGLAAWGTCCGAGGRVGWWWVPGWVDGPVCKERRAAGGRCSVCSGHRMSLKCRSTLLVGVHLEYF